jgi:hypothetical protein
VGGLLALTAVRFERSRPDGLRDPVRPQPGNVCGQGVAICAVRIAGKETGGDRRRRRLVLAREKHLDRLTQSGALRVFIVREEARSDLVWPSGTAITVPSEAMSLGLRPYRLMRLF